MDEYGKDTGGCSVVVSTLARQARDLGSIPSTCLMFFNLFIHQVQKGRSGKGVKEERVSWDWGTCPLIPNHNPNLTRPVPPSPIGWSPLRSQKCRHLGTIPG